jgi:hypothetical protein
MIIVALVALTTSPLQAQTSGNRPDRGYVFAGAGVARQEGATDEEPRIYLEAPGGTTGMWFFGGGIFAARWLSIEGELRRTGRLEAVEPSRYFITYLAQRRDTFLSFGGRLHTFPRAALDLEPVVTFDMVREESWLAQSTVLPGLAATGDFDKPVPFVNGWSRGIGVGADVRIGRGDVAFVPGARFRRVWRGEDATSTWPGGRTEWAVELGAALRVTF